MVYERSILVFLDILGFGKLVEDAPAHKISALLEILRQAARPDNALAKELR